MEYIPVYGDTVAAVDSNHRFGTDAILLSHFAMPCGGDTVCELGTGCGAIALRLAAACSTGQALPGMTITEPVNVIYQTAEDGLGDTIKPRLMEAGADDFEADGDVFTIYTLPDDFNDVVANLGKYTFVSAQIEMVPQNYQKLENDDQVKLMEKMIEIMEDDDDVQNVWHNWEE